jgi:hypothetical protein
LDEELLAVTLRLIKDEGDKKSLLTILFKNVTGSFKRITMDQQCQTNVDIEELMCIY